MCGVTRFQNQDTVQCLYTITQYTRYTLFVTSASHQSLIDHMYTVLQTFTPGYRQCIRQYTLYRT